MKRLGMISFLSMILALVIPICAGAEALLIPVGRIVGLQLRDDQVTIAAFDDSMGGYAKECGLKIGDRLLCVNGTAIRSPGDVRQALTDHPDCAKLTVLRGSREINIQMEPRVTEEGPRLGIYLRQGIAGIGTVTWFDPASGTFGALGHGVSTPGGCLMAMTEGTAFPAEVTGVVRGKCGHPGQLKGSAETASCGQILRNTPQGIFGKAGSGWSGEAVPTAEAEELHTGSAVILSTVCSGQPREYTVEILKLYPTDRSDGRNLLLKVTDPALLEITGGIVQGMSGSPILQDGKLIGAVTHVLVNDPTMGYGIFIGNMLDAAA